MTVDDKRFKGVAGAAFAAQPFPAEKEFLLSAISVYDALRKQKETIRDLKNENDSLRMEMGLKAMSADPDGRKPLIKASSPATERVNAMLANAYYEAHIAEKAARTAVWKEPDSYEPLSFGEWVAKVPSLAFADDGSRAYSWEKGRKDLLAAATLEELKAVFAEGLKGTWERKARALKEKGEEAKKTAEEEDGEKKETVEGEE